MTNLSNVDIEKAIKEGKIKIVPYEPKNMQGATIDLRLGGKFLIPQDYDYEKTPEKGFIELKDKMSYKEIESNEILILPQQFILGSTLETVVFNNEISGRVDGKSRIARKGLVIQNAGHIGPGFEGEITLELFNQRKFPIKLYYGEEICQIEFNELKSPSTKPYQGKYKNQKGPRV